MNSSEISQHLWQIIVISVLYSAVIEVCLYHDFDIQAVSGAQQITVYLR